MRPQEEKDEIRTKLQAILADPESGKEVVDEQVRGFFLFFLGGMHSARPS
jgi:hypothetical protein